MSKLPSRIICLTEESVELLYLLGEEKRIVGRSQFVKRPKEAKKIPIVSQYIRANSSKILKFEPDLILGHSDLQKDIAADLIGQGQNVFIANHRSLDETLNYIHLLGSIVGKEKAAKSLVKKYQNRINSELRKNKKRKVKRVYFEEWDEPRICSIKWVSELIKVCGGKNIFEKQSNSVLAKDRFIQDKDIIRKNPHLIFLCWCGKKVKINSVYEREGYEKIMAIKNQKVFELMPEVFLQPGPALFEDGIKLMSDLIHQ